MHAPIALDPMIAAMEHARAGLPDAYVETLHVTASDGAFDAEARVRDADYRVDVRLDGEAYGFGRVAGFSWRRTPNGFVRIVRSDIQGDPLDRWPRALFGFSSEFCTADGTTGAGAGTLWVLRCARPGDAEHWYEIGASSGAVLHEIDRDGAKVTTYDFIDDRHWTIHGFGGGADVRVTQLSPASVSGDDVAVPQQGPALFALPSSGVANVPVNVSRYSLETPVQIDGQTRTFGIDTGTTQILIDIGEAARLGLHPRFGHVIIPELRVGDAVAHNVAAQAVDLFHDGFVSGLLGFEFFGGNIVHIDDRKGVVQLLDRKRFISPAGAQPLQIDVREGLPLVTAGVNGVTGSRFALDTGSYWPLLSAGFAESIGADRDFEVMPPKTEHFLEGPLSAALFELPEFDFANVRFKPADAEVVIPEPADMDFPLDGIIGQSVLSEFEWWFDYADDVAWIRNRF